MKQGKEDRAWDLRLSAWFDGEASEMDAAEVRAHLMESPEARAKIQEWRSLRDDLALLQPEAPSAEQLLAMQSRFEDGLADEVFRVARALRLWNRAAVLLLTLGLGMWVADRLLLSVPTDTYASEPSAIDEAIREFLAAPASQD
ncbi:MAG: zf-HC2 domain-containing protein [Planctomycetota bacterium]|jgi:anti-sigma factor RsiW|nr:zf-HC2 domain-containing protein [Planctomycetota bacterium]